MRKAAVMISVSMAMGLVVATGTSMAKRVDLTVWHALYGGWSKDFFDEAVRVFERNNPGVKVRMVGVDVSGEKFLTAMSAGSPPDVIFPDGPQVVQWAHRNLLTPLGRYLKTSKVDSGLFWGPAFKHGLWNGQPYALPWIADGIGTMVCSKRIFDEVGIAKPPENIEELELYVRKMNRTDANGNYSRFGYVPVGGDYLGANNLFTHGWAFGGGFYDDAKHKVTLNNPRVVDALNWIRDFVQRANPTKYTAFVDRYASWGKPQPVASGRVGMNIYLSSFLDDIAVLKMKPTDFLYGWMNGPEGTGEKRSSWMGGWHAAIPANTRNSDTAWKFIKFVCYDQEGTNLTYRKTRFLPGTRNAEAFRNPSPEAKPFLDVFLNAKHNRPVTPVTPVLWKEMERVMPLVIKGKKETVPALNEANAIVQKQLDAILARKK